MGELGERLWSVISERGREASKLLYDEAVECERELKAGGVSGLCVVTDAAAGRLTPSPDARKAATRDGDSGGSDVPKRGDPKRTRRASKGGNRK